jgi:hypothetical protein
VALSGARDLDGPTVVASCHGHKNLDQDDPTVVASRHGHRNLEQMLVVAAVPPSGTMGQDGPTVMVSPHELLLMWKRGERKQRAMPWQSL